jgi:hypothetical protein
LQKGESSKNPAGNKKTKQDSASESEDELPIMQLFDKGANKKPQDEVSEVSPFPRMFLTQDGLRLNH